MMQKQINSILEIGKVVLDITKLILFFIQNLLLDF